MTEEQNGNNKNPAEKKPEVALTERGLMPRDIDQAWRYATALANSQFVPETYRGKAGDLNATQQKLFKINNMPVGG